MKKGLTLFAALCVFMVGASAHAARGVRTCTPEETGPNSTLMAPIPLAGFGFVTAFCKDGDNLRRINPYVEVCRKWNKWSSNCEQSETVYDPQVTPIEYQARECVETRHTPQESWCVRYETVTRRHSLSFEIDYYKRRGPDPFYKPECQVTYTIPNCQ